MWISPQQCTLNSETYSVKKKPKSLKWLTLVKLWAKGGVHPGWWLAHCRANIERQRTVHTLGQYTLAHLSIAQMHVSGLQEEARVPEAIPHWHGEEWRSPWVLFHIHHINIRLMPHSQQNFADSTGYLLPQPWQNLLFTAPLPMSFSAALSLKMWENSY